MRQHDLHTIHKVRGEGILSHIRALVLFDMPTWIMR